MPRWRGVVSRRSLVGLALLLVSSLLSLHLSLAQCVVIGDREGWKREKLYLCLFPASSSPSTVELKLPSAPSTTVSQLLCISSHAALLLPCFPSFSPPLASPPCPFTGPLERVA